MPFSGIKTPLSVCPLWSLVTYQIPAHTLGLPGISSLAPPPGVVATNPDQLHIIFLAPEARCSSFPPTSALPFLQICLLGPQETGSPWIQQPPDKTRNDGEMGIPRMEPCTPWLWTQKPGGHPRLLLHSSWHRDTCFADLGGCSAGRAPGMIGRLILDITNVHRTPEQFTENEVCLSISPSSGIGPIGHRWW